MLLEEETPSPVSEGEMSIPPQPDFDKGYDASVADEPVNPPPSAFAGDQEGTPRGSPVPQELAPATLFDAPATAEQELPPEYEIVPEPDMAPEPEPESAPVLVEEKLEEKKTASKPEPKSKAGPTRPPASAQASAKLSSWVIQVASLRDQKRAYSLVQDLRAKGFPAYMEEAEVKQKLWHRVRIGPEIERKQIESMAASLERKTGMKGQIQRYR
jgi:DedD protein